jgi:N-acetylglucosamine-6-phosphate deacetylase
VPADTSWTLVAGRILTPDEELAPGAVTLDRAAGVVTALAALEPATGGIGWPAGAVDLGDRVVVPGFVDVHTHGGAGHFVNGDDPSEVAAALAKIGRLFAAHGTTAFVATTVSDTRQRTLATLQGVAEARARDAAMVRPTGARVVGANLEGPFIAPARMGAHAPTQLRSPDRAELDEWIDVGAGAVLLVTVAPELPGALDVIEHARQRGLQVAVGHTDADFATVRRAFEAGATHVTHLFNAMSPLHHREPGSVGAALVTPGITLEVIADLEHVHPAALLLAARCAPGRLVAVTDSVPAAGLGEGRHLLGDREVVVAGGRVMLADDPATLAGSVLTMDGALANLAGPAGLGWNEALRAVTSTPGAIVGGGYGRIEPGGPADLVVLEPDLRVAATIVGGQPVHDPGGLLA